MKILTGIAIFILICLLLVFLESWRENRKVKAVQYHYPDFPLQNWKGTKIMLLSDLHNCVYGRNNEKLLRLVQGQNPDIILIAGDMLVGKKDADFGDAVHFLNNLAEMDCPIYYGHGNHELRTKLYKEQYGDMYERFRKELSPKIKFLINESVTLEKDGELLKIFGLDLDRKYYQRFKKVQMEEQYLAHLWEKDQKEKNPSDERKKAGLENEKKGLFSILIAHNPLYFKEYAKQLEVDMVVSGHYHGCMVRLPILGGVLSPQIGFFPKYVAGEYRQGDSMMYLSAGLGNHSIKLRIGNIPEVVVVTL
ncbi:MAG: metallophosphoesterase [Lachnospiraceae bacterium]|nr:metallophosphoesterase [Lachnospiraceae bacterium]